jgi:hypothetical protein
MPTVSQAINSLPTTVKNVAHERMKEVHSLQRSFGMEPRDDSTLTLAYATGKITNMSASSVAKELVIVDRLHKQTFYSIIIEQVMRNVTNYFHEKYPQIHWGDLWKVTRFYIPEALKLYCLRFYNKSSLIHL